MKVLFYVDLKKLMAKFDLKNCKHVKISTKKFDRKQKTNESKKIRVLTVKAIMLKID